MPVVDEWISMEHWWNNTDRGKLRYSEEKKLFPVLLCSPEIPHRLVCVWTWASELRGQWLIVRVRTWPVLSRILWMGPLLQVIAVVLPWFVNLHNIKAKIVMAYHLGRMKKQVLLASIKDCPDVCLMRLNKATKELI